MTLLDTKLKVKLPRRYVLRIVPFFIRQGYAYLNDLEKVYVTTHGLVVVVGRSLEGTNRACNYAWKFGVLRAA